VDRAIGEQLATLDTRDVASVALRNGFVCVCDSEDEMLAVADRIASEHLEIMTRDPNATADRLRNAGALFIGPGCAEVFGDYGAGPNHTLPTGGSARFQAGLSVTSFLRLRTWMRIDDPAGASGLVDDTRRIAAMEGLSGHAAAAAARRVV
jgi:histidinol dehydrogenase